MSFFLPFYLHKDIYFNYMMITKADLISKDQTGRAMHRLIRQYSKDLDHVKVWYKNKLTPFSALPLDVAFNIVRRIPYRRDVKPIEVIARPREIFKNRSLGMDCKKKAILLGSYLRQRKLPYRLVASSRLRNRRIHHVFPQMGFFGNWLNFDATYPHYNAFEPKRVTKVEVLNG